MLINYAIDYPSSHHFSSITLLTFHVISDYRLGSCMAFIKFKESGRSYAPRATISTYGTLSFSEGARRRFSLDNYSHAILYYDPDTKRIGIELTNNRKAEGARTLRHRKTGADMAVKPFLDYFDINVDTTTLYDIEKDDRSGMLIIDRKTGKERKSRKNKD